MHHGRQGGHKYKTPHKEARSQSFIINSDIIKAADRNLDAVLDVVEKHVDEFSKVNCGTALNRCVGHEPYILVQASFGAFPWTPMPRPMPHGLIADMKLMRD